MSLPLLQTKLYAPPPRPQRVRRAHLLTHLEEQFGRPLTLVCAPAGFGKTTLVSDWIAQTSPQVAWLSLDEDDNDPIRFLSYLLAALHCQPLHLGATAQALLAAPQPPPPKAILTSLLNDLGNLAAPLTLILDDYHLITAPAIHEALTFLIDHLPPAFHLVITSRIDPPLPLARWRVRNQLTEIRADNLRFTPVEAATFLNQVMGLALTDTQIAALETRTEGWIAGLQLAALSMQGRADVAGFIQAFSGSHRHVLTYLVEEVLNRCPAGTLDFLLQTAILDQLSAPLCNAVTGRSDSQTVLEQLEQANLFLLPLDEHGQWYRYHQLFAEALRARLQQAHPHLVTELYRRAGDWCEQNGHLPAAVQHALTCHDYARAAALIEQVDLTFFPDPSLQPLLNQWLGSLPATVVRSHARLCVIHAWLLWGRFALADALQWVQQAEAALHARPDPTAAQTRTVRHEILTLRALFLAYAPQADFAQAIADGEEVLMNAAPERAGLRSMAAGAIATAYLKQGDLAQGERFLTQAMQIGQAAGEVYVTVASAVNLALAQRAAGSLRKATALCQQIVDWVITQSNANHPALGTLYTTLADLLCEGNELAAAEQYANQGISFAEQWERPYSALISRFVLLRVKQAQGQWEAVWALWQEIASHTEQAQAAPTSFLPVVNIQLLLRQGRVTEVTAWFYATKWLEATPATILTGQEFVYSYEYNRTVRAQVALALARAAGDYALLHELLDHLARQQQAATREGLLWLRIKVYCLQALAYAALSEKEQAFAVLTQAIILAEPEGYIRLFVDEGEAMRFLIADCGLWLVQQSQTPENTRLSVYSDKILASFDHEASTVDEPLLVVHSKIANRKSKIQNLIDPLSDRELEVLQLVADGLSNGEIAAQLIVSKGTVKTHINHIFGKLGVQSRTQAIVRGRALGLINGN